jgi:hypothetical protein
MAALQRIETAVGPVAVGGRTLTFVARATAVRMGDGSRGALHLRARPLYVEVLDERGERRIVRVHDTERTVVASVLLGALATTALWRARRRARRRSR